MRPSQLTAPSLAPPYTQKAVQQPVFGVTILKKTIELSIMLFRASVRSTIRYIGPRRIGQVLAHLPPCGAVPPLCCVVVWPQSGRARRGSRPASLVGVEVQPWGGRASLSADFAREADDQGPHSLIRRTAPLTHAELNGAKRVRDDTVEKSRRTTEARVPLLKLSIIMAVYNEDETIEQAVDEVLKVDYPCDIELIIVDDGSTDQTSQLLAMVDDPRVAVFRHFENRGKGAALLTALTFVSGTYTIPFDADLEYVPDDILKLIEPVLRGRCSVVYGVRLFGYNTVYRSYVYAAGNRLLTRLTNVMFGACLSDLHTCLKLIPTSMLKSLPLRESGFGLDTEISASLLRSGVRPFEVPVSYFSRSHEEGKKISWRDAFGCLWILLRIRAQPRSWHRDPSAQRVLPKRYSAINGGAASLGQWQTQQLRVAEPDRDLGIGASN